MFVIQSFRKIKIKFVIYFIIICTIHKFIMIKIHIFSGSDTDNLRQKQGIFDILLI